MKSLTAKSKLMALYEKNLINTLDVMEYFEKMELPHLKEAIEDRINKLYLARLA